MLTGAAAAEGTDGPPGGELKGKWWAADCKGEQMMDLSLGNKFVLLLEILKKCEEIGDKV